MNRKDQIILLVEDSDDDVELARRAFNKSGIANELVVVGDGEAALDYLFASGAHSGRDPAIMPQVVLLDLKLPGMNGLEVLARLRADERTELLPVVILTTSDEQQDLIGSYKLGANSLRWTPRLRQPVNPLFAVR